MLSFEERIVHANRRSTSEKQEALPQTELSCRQDLVGGAEEFVVDAVRPNPGQGQPAHERPQEWARAAQIVTCLVEGRVSLQPLSIRRDAEFLLVGAVSA
jgi:hypothetical protein